MIAAAGKKRGTWR